MNIAVLDPRRRETHFLFMFGEIQDENGFRKKVIEKLNIFPLRFMVYDETIFKTRQKN